MNSFAGFVKKEFLHIFRDPRTLLILFGMPVAQIMIFGYVITNEIKDIPIAIFDQAKDRASREISNKLVSSGYFSLKMNLNSIKEVEPVLRQGEVKEVIVFEPDFNNKMESGNKGTVQLLTDASDPNTANLIVSYTSGIIRDYALSRYGSEKMPSLIEPKIRMMYNQDLKGVFMFVPGTMALILMLISAMMTSISISREKELGTMEVLMVSPIKPFQIVVGKLIPYIVLSFINAVVIIALGTFVFGLPVRGSLILLLLESLLFISLALSLGILISTVSNSQMVAMFISLIGLMLPTILLSGFIYPIENMPLILQWISNIMPPKWYIIIVKDIMIKGEGLRFVWKETLIMLGMTLFFMLAAIKRFKIRLE